MSFLHYSHSEKLEFIEKINEFNQLLADLFETDIEEVTYNNIGKTLEVTTSKEILQFLFEDDKASIVFEQFLQLRRREIRGCAGQAFLLEDKALLDF